MKWAREHLFHTVLLYDSNVYKNGSVGFVLFFFNFGISGKEYILFFISANVHQPKYTYSKSRLGKKRKEEKTLPPAIDRRRHRVVVAATSRNDQTGNDCFPLYPFFFPPISVGMVWVICGEPKVIYHYNETKIISTNQRMQELYAVRSEDTNIKRKSTILVTREKFDRVASKIETRIFCSITLTRGTCGCGEREVIRNDSRKNRNINLIFPKFDSFQNKLGVCERICTEEAPQSRAYFRYPYKFFSSERLITMGNSIQLLKNCPEFSQ